MFSKNRPRTKIIRPGIGDVTEPLPPAVAEAMDRAIDEMGRRETQRGSGPEQATTSRGLPLRSMAARLRRRRIRRTRIFVSDPSEADAEHMHHVCRRGRRNGLASAWPMLVSRARRRRI